MRMHSVHNKPPKNAPNLQLMCYRMLGCVVLADVRTRSSAITLPEPAHWLKFEFGKSLNRDHEDSVEMSRFLPEMFERWCD